MKYLFSTFHNMGLPHKLCIFFVKDKKETIKSSYQIQLLIQHRSKTLAFPLSHVLSGYVALFSRPMHWESCVSVLPVGPCHILHKSRKFTSHSSQAKYTVPQIGPKMLQRGDVLTQKLATFSSLHTGWSQGTPFC